jgi:hypothetical protein
MELKCKTPGCKVVETGKCLEGFTIDECPHVTKVEDVEEPPPPPPEIIVPDEVTIPLGRVLNLEGATDVLISGPSRVLTIIGPSRSGKTTFCLSIYDAFQRGSFGPWSFSGSLTLPGFELRCYLSRAQSGNTKADTPRSLLSEGLGFLHLNLYDQSEYFNLLISERSGEHYEQVANSLEDTKDLFEVNRADYLLFFVDGEKLSSDKERHGVKTDMTSIVRTLVTSETITPEHRIAIVLTKMDHVTNCLQHERTLADFEDLVEKLRKIFYQDQDIIEFKIASRSAHLHTPHHLGVIELLQHCLKQRVIKKYDPDPIKIPDRFFLKSVNHKAETL